MMTDVPALRLLGFPVRVKPGFLAFLALVIIWNPGVGWKFAIAVTIFSLVHELGHATAAKRLGAQPEIALDFLAGSTRYTPPRPITPIERAWVAVSGPAVEIVLGLVVLGVCVWDDRAKFDEWKLFPEVTTTYLKLFDPAARNNGKSIAAGYKVSGIPSFFLIGRDGKILLGAVGNSDATKQQLDEALAAAGLKL